jgi:mRNA interferase RelE/StbE
VKVEYRKRFLRELAKIPSAQRKEIEIFVFDRLPHIQSVAESGKIEGMKGYSGFSRSDLVIIGSVSDRKVIP